MGLKDGIKIWDQRILVRNSYAPTVTCHAKWIATILKSDREKKHPQNNYNCWFPRGLQHQMQFLITLL